jgi:hypothetical protein
MVVSGWRSVPEVGGGGRTQKIGGERDELVYGF